MTEFVLSHRTFSNETFEKCFSDLFETSDQQNGPLTQILNNYVMTPAKGGTFEKFSEYYDMPYFVHVLNACIVAGRIFETKMIKEDKSPANYETLIRLFFSAMVLHDSNKLFESGNYRASQELKKTLTLYRQEIVKIVEPYLKTLGNIEKWLPDLEYLILDTEEGSREQGGQYKTNLPRPELEEVARYLKLGDQISRGLNSKYRKNIYEHIIESARSFKLEEEINYLSLPEVPQTLMHLNFVRLVSKALERNNRRIILMAPDSIIYFGKTLDHKIMREVSESFHEKIFFKDTKKYLENFAPSANSLKFDFARKIKPTPVVIDQFIEMYNSRLLLWSKPEWRKRHSDFPIISKNFGVQISSSDKKGDIKFKLDFFEETDEDEDINRKRNIAKLTCAKRILLEFKNDKETETSIKQLGLLDDFCDTILKKTLIAIAFCKDYQDSPEEIYNKLLLEISEEMTKSYPFEGNDERRLTSDYLLNYFLGQISFNEISTEVPDKKDSCIQCGLPSKIGLERIYSFGYKPTDGGGKKLSKLSDSENYKGKICELCIMENELRKREFGNLDNSICIRINVSDWIAPIDVSKLFSSLKADTLEDLKIEKVNDNNFVVWINNSQKMRIDRHSLGFVGHPEGMIAEYFLFRKLLNLIMGTGLKISVSPLFISEPTFKPMFEWENCPGWLKVLGYDYIRIDQVPGVLREMRLVLSIAQMSRGEKDIPDVLRSLTIGPPALIGKIWDYYAKKKKNSFWLKNNEEEIYFFLRKNRECMNLTKMEEIVDAACDIDNNAPETNNDHTRLIRKGLDVYERNNGKPGVDTDDLKNMISGRIWKIARAKPKNNNRKSEEGSIRFSSALIELLMERFGGESPTGERKRDVIAQFAIMYNIEKWRRVKSRTSEAEKTGSERNE